MKYSKVKKEFSTFSVGLLSADELRNDIKKVGELKDYYQQRLDKTDEKNKKYFYDLWEFYAERKLELEELLERYEQELGEMIKILYN